MIIAEICIYMIFSSKQLKMEKHKAKPFSQNFIKRLEFLKRNSESLSLPSAPYFLCLFNHSFQKSKCNPVLDRLPYCFLSFHTPNFNKEFPLYPATGFSFSSKFSHWLAEKAQSRLFTDICYKLISLAVLSSKFLKG